MTGIYEAITNVMNDIGIVGKNKKNSSQGFMFRGIDDVMNALSPALIKNKVFIVPEVLNEERTERQTLKGGVLFCTRITVAYKFYTTDGSFIEAKVIGEAMDSGDKATNKALSIAYKYACFQVFSIPTDSIEDESTDFSEVAQSKIDAIKIKAMRELMERKGVNDDAIKSRYNIGSLEDMNMEQYMDCIKGLNASKDVEKVDLGL